jgi:hypothetical protein
MTMYHQVASWMQFFTLYQSCNFSHSTICSKLISVPGVKTLGPTSIRAILHMSPRWTPFFWGI